MPRVSTRRLLSVIYLPPLGVLAALVAVGLAYRLDASELTRDVASIAGVDPLVGFLSSLGIVVWSGTVGVCFFAAGLLRARSAGSTEIEHRRFLASAGALSAYLLIDDLFLVHDHLATTHLGIPETMVYALIGIAVASHVLRFRRVIERNAPVLFLFSCAFLTGSVAVDVVLERWLWRLDHWSYIVEDGAKWLGITGWFGYHATVAARLVSAATRAAD